MFMHCLRDTLGLDLQMHQTEQMSNKGYTEVTYILTTLFLVASGENKVPPLEVKTDINDFYFLQKDST